MDPVNILGIGAKIGGMINLVLEEDSGDFVTNEVGWLRIDELVYEWD